MILATGVAYRRLGIPALDELNGAGVFYGASAVRGASFAGEDVYIVGGGNSAGQAAMHLSRHAHCVHILVRGDHPGGHHVAVPAHQVDRTAPEHQGADQHRGRRRRG